jgi:hypothetical protein
MTEAEWLQCRNPNRMLSFLRGAARAGRSGVLETVFRYLRGRGTRETQPPPASPRKLRLFACACCRQVWPLIVNEQSRNAIEVAEQFADGQVKKRVLTAARHQARQAVPPRLPAPAWHATWEAVWAGARLAARASAQLQRRATAERVAFARLRREQCTLLRDIFGNPFRPWAVPVDWPASVVHLAESLYAGEDCAFALRDALLETGHPEWAEHFGAGPHPKGCWAVDHILGKR